MNILPKAQRSFQPIKAQRNFRNKFFDSIEIAEWHFCTKLKRNLTSEIEISQHNANTPFLRFLIEKE